jgi:hypothetical protein
VTLALQNETQGHRRGPRHRWRLVNSHTRVCAKCPTMRVIWYDSYNELNQVRYVQDGIEVGSMSPLCLEPQEPT